MTIVENDIHLEYNPLKCFYDLELTEDGSDLLPAVNLRTAIGISLFTDKRSRDDDRIPNERGWAGDAIRFDEEDKLGSLLWLFQGRKTLDEHLPTVEEYCRTALQWLLDDNIAITLDVTVIYESKPRGVMLINIAIKRFTGENEQFPYVWEQKLVA